MASAPKIDPPIPIKTIVLNFLNLFKSLVLKFNLKFLSNTLRVFFYLLFQILYLKIFYQIF